MTTLLTDNLPLLAGSPNGVDRLRVLIRDLAVTGRLVPHEADASGWQWSTLGSEISGMDAGWSPACLDTPASTDEVWGVLRTTAVQPLRYVQAENKELPANLAPRPEAEVKAGDVLFTRAGPMNRVGISCLVDSTRPKLMLSDKIIRFRPNPQRLDGRFTALCLNAGTTARYLEAAKSGMAASQVNISQAKLKAAPVPVPPLAEQHRIVAKVDELMALCDRLEAEQADAEAAHAKLVEALLASLTQARDAADFRASWQQLAEHFHTLFTTEASVDALEAAVLTLAVTGKLSSSRESSGALTQYDARAVLPPDYERLQKQRITGAPVTTLDELPPLPNGWVYRSIDHLYRLNHIVDYADGNHGSDYPTKAEFGDQGVLFLTAAQIAADGSVDWGNCPRLQHAKASTLTKGWARPGDVLLTHNATVGRTAIYANCSEETALLGTSVTFYRVNDKTMSNEYLYLFFTSAVWFDQMAAVMRQTTRNQVSITKQALFFVSLPPLEEQLRIAADVKPLRETCARLRELVTKTRLARERLASVLVEQAVA